jgi:hypothetical protein
MPFGLVLPGAALCGPLLQKRSKERRLIRIENSRGIYEAAEKWLNAIQMETVIRMDAARRSA